MTQTAKTQVPPAKGVVFTMGGKGGVGKTGVMVALAEWFAVNEIPVTLLDLNTENKARGSLKHFFNGSVTKVNIHTLGYRSDYAYWTVRGDGDTRLPRYVLCERAKLTIIDTNHRSHPSEL
jgi:hypothetical protein